MAQQCRLPVLASLPAIICSTIGFVLWIICSLQAESATVQVLAEVDLRLKSNFDFRGYLIGTAAVIGTSTLLLLLVAVWRQWLTGEGPYWVLESRNYLVVATLCISMLYFVQLALVASIAGYTLWAFGVLVAERTSFAALQRLAPLFTHLDKVQAQAEAVLATYHAATNATMLHYVSTGPIDTSMGLTTTSPLPDGSLLVLAKVADTAVRSAVWSSFDSLITHSNAVAAQLASVAVRQGDCPGSCLNLASTEWFDGLTCVCNFDAVKAANVWAAVAWQRLVWAIVGLVLIFAGVSWGMILSTAGAARMHVERRVIHQRWLEAQQHASSAASVTSMEGGKVLF